MAKKKKFHPGGNVPPVAGRRVTGGTVTTPARRPRQIDQLEKNSRALARQRFKEAGFGSERAFRTAMANASPAEQRSMSNRLQTVSRRLMKQFNIDNKDLIAQRRAADQARRKAAMERRKNARIQPMMPTGGMDRMGRPVQGTTAMPGPAPDAARMRRMQQLMRRQASQRRQAQRGMQQQQQRRRTIGLSDSFQSRLNSRPFNPRSQRQRQTQQRFTNARKALQVNRGPRPPRMR